MATDERPSRKFVKKSESPFAGVKERGRNALITGTAGGYLGGMLIEGKARVKVPAFTRKLLRMKRKTIGIHGARTGAAIGAAAGAANRGKRSETVDSVATGGDWKFSAYIEDMTFGSLPKEVQKDVQRFVTAEKGTPVVHYGMTVKELISKADPENLKAARKALGTLRASKAADEVISRTKDGSKYVLIMNDRIVDGHHFLAKAERGGVTSSLNVLDLTPARLTTRFSAKEMGLFLLEEMRKNRTRDLRDKIGLAKDVAGLAGTTAAGIGGVKLYKAAKKGIQEAAPKVGAAARSWHRAGVKAGKTLDTVKDAVAPAAATNRGIKAVVGGVKRAAARLFVARGAVRQFEAAPRRSKLQNVRDAALTGAGVAVTGAGVAAAMKAREAGKVADNIRNTTAIGADVGKVYRKARKVVTDSAEAFKGGMREAAGKPAPSWAKRTVRIGKKLRLLEEGSQFPVRRSQLNEFILGALGTVVGTLAGSAAGARFRYPVQNALKKKLVPKLGKTWGKRVARAGSFAPENAGALAGGAAGSFLTGGMRKKPEEEQFNAMLAQALHQFGGNEQLADLDNSRFVDPFSKWLKGEKGYRRADVGDYHKLRRRLLGRDLKPEQIAKIQGAMADIKANKAVDVAGGQVLHSALRKADTVRKVSERGSGLVRDAVKAAKGEAREKDRWGREKKREWEKPWFQRRRNQLIATGGLLAAGYLGRHTKVGARAVRKGEEMINKGRTWANKKLANVFPDEGTEAARAAHNAKVTGKPQSTPADILKETEEMAKATRKEASQLNKAKKKVEAQGPELKLVPESKPAPKPADSKPADKSVRAPVSKPAAAPAPKPADKSVRAPISQAPVSKAPPPPVSSSGSPWSQSKIPTVSTNEKRHEAAVKAASKPAAPKKKEAPVFESMWGSADKPKKPKKFAALLRQALTQFEKPFAGYNPKRHARTGGLNDSFRKSYNREHGSNLKRPVTTPPSKLKPGSEAAGRRKSFCARMSGMRGPTSKGGKLTPKGAALRRWNCMAIQALTQFADPLDVGWDIRDARGNSARVFAPHAGQRDRRPKRWHERVENERKLWAGAALTSTLAGGAAMRKLLGKQTKQTVDREVKRRVAQIGAAVKKRYTVKRAPGSSGGGRAPNVVPFTPKEAA